MKIYERPGCVICKELAICTFGGKWVCGKCIEKIMNKEQKRKQDILNELFITE